MKAGGSPLRLQERCGRLHCQSRRTAVRARQGHQTRAKKRRWGTARIPQVSIRKLTYPRTAIIIVFMSQTFGVWLNQAVRRSLDQQAGCPSNGNLPMTG